MNIWDLIWNGGILNPIINLLLIFYGVLGENFFFALIMFTLFARLCSLPLTLKQQSIIKGSSPMGQKVQEIRDKYKDDPQRMQEAYTEIGYDPFRTVLGCLPTFIQITIFIGLYRAIFYLSTSTSENVDWLSGRLYDWDWLNSLIPINKQIFWFSFDQPDPIFILPILVGITAYFSQRFSKNGKFLPSFQTNKHNRDKKESKRDGENVMTGDYVAQYIQKNMFSVMPILLGVMSTQFLSGLSVYIIVSNIFSIGQTAFMRKRNLQQTISETQ